MSSIVDSFRSVIVKFVSGRARYSYDTFLVGKISMEHNGRSRSFPSRQKRRLRAFGSAFKVFIAPLNKLSWLWLEVQTLSRPTSSRMAFLNSLHPKSLHFMEQHVECRMQDAITRQPIVRQISSPEVTSNDNDDSTKETNSARVAFI